MSRANPNRYESSASVTAMLKTRLCVDDVLTALGLDSDLGVECPSQHCGALDALVQTANGDGWRCKTCDASGDIFTLVMERRDMTFPRARDWLEANALPKRRDGKTRDLFAESSSRDSGKAGRAAGGQSALPHGAGRAARRRTT